jgi:hypothetical protein
MAGRRSPVTDIRELLRRLQLGEPDRRIARDLEISRNTVARYREWATAQMLLPGALPEPAVLAALLQPAPTERPAHEQGRSCWTDSPRLPANCRSELGTGRGATLHGHENGRAQNGGDLPALRHR